MAGFDDLIEFASRAGRLMDNECTVTEGRNIRHRYRVRDASGADVDLSSGYTFDCKIITDVDGSTVATMSVTGTSTGFTVTATAATMASTAGSSATASRPRRLLWYCSVTRTSDSAKVQVWGPSNSPFVIAPE